MTIEQLSLQTAEAVCVEVRLIHEDDEAERIEAVDEIIGKALSEWGMEMVQDTLDRANKIIAALENPDSLLPFSWSPHYAYHKAHYCCRDIGTWRDPYRFNSASEAIEWIINHGPAYTEKDNAARFGGGQ